MSNSLSLRQAMNFQWRTEIPVNCNNGVKFSSGYTRASGSKVLTVTDSSQNHKRRAPAPARPNPPSSASSKVSFLYMSASSKVNSVAGRGHRRSASIASETRRRLPSRGFSRPLQDRWAPYAQPISSAATSFLQLYIHQIKKKTRHLSFVHRPVQIQSPAAKMAGAQKF